MEKIKQTISKIRPIDESLLEKAQKRLDNLTKPQGSLGRLEEFARRMVAVTGSDSPPFERKVIFTLVGDHGVAEEGVSAFPQEVTRQMVQNFLNGGAGINVLAKHVGAKVLVVDMGVAADLGSHPGLIEKKVGYGTRNLARGPAMTREEAVESIIGGVEAFEEEWEEGGIDIVGVGDMGIANTTPSSAIISAITRRGAAEVTGRGTGISDEQLQNKIRVIERAIELNRPDPRYPLDVLAKVGGFEIGGIAGVILSAASHQVPVVIDGLISTAGALLASELAPKAKGHLFAAHRSAEIGHRTALEWMGLRPILNLDMRLGEGTGAALAIGLIEAGVKILTQMATFADAGVSERLE